MCVKKSSVSAWMPRVIANEFSEAADDLYLHALIEIGLLLFIITLLVNGVSRLLIWRMGRQGSAPRRTAVPVASAAGGAA